MNDGNSVHLSSGSTTPWWGLPLLRRTARDHLGFAAERYDRFGAIRFLRMGLDRAYDLLDPALLRQALVDHSDCLERWERGIDVIEQAFGRSLLVTERESRACQRPC